MKRGLLYMSLLLSWVFSAENLHAQDLNQGDGIEIVVPKNAGRKLNSYFIINGGFQNQYMVRVPMIPENTSPVDYVIEDNLMAHAQGYSFGMGVLNKTGSFLDIGLLADYYNNSVDIAISGERSMGPWISEQNGGISELTEPFDADHQRVSEVYVIRAAIRLKLPLGPVNFWVGITGGTYTSTVRYTKRDEVSFFNSSSKTLIAPSYQTGVDLMIRNHKEEDVLSMTFFADFSSPKMEESMYDIVFPGWDFSVPEGNQVISPIRFGLAIGIH